jgi:hypothetical protein
MFWRLYWDVSQQPLAHAALHTVKNTWHLSKSALVPPRAIMDFLD